MKYFITGGAGFIGSHMADKLLRAAAVTVYDNLSSGRIEHLAAHEGDSGFQFIKGEVGDLDRLAAALAGHDIVCHFASNPDIARGAVETDLDLREGTILTYNVLEAMRRTDAREIIYASGSGVYGDVGDTPTPEDFGPLLPVSMYGAAKLAGEALVSAFCQLFELRGHIFRFANVVGERQTHGVGYDFIRKLRKDPSRLVILGDGRQSKSYIHVSDAVEAMLFAAARSPEKVGIFNAAADDYLDVAAIARIVIEEMGLKEVDLEYTGGDRGWKGDVPVVRFDIGKIHKLGWRAKYGSREAVRKSIREMLADLEEA